MESQIQVPNLLIVRNEDNYNSFELKLSCHYSYYRSRQKRNTLNKFTQNASFPVLQLTSIVSVLVHEFTKTTSFRARVKQAVQMDAPVLITSA